MKKAPGASRGLFSGLGFRLELDAEPDVAASVRRIGRRDALAADGVAEEAGIEEQTRVAEVERSTDRVLEEALLELVGLTRQTGPRAPRVGEVAGDAGIVPDAAVDRDRLIEVGELFGAEAEAVLLRIAVVLLTVQVAHADVDARFRDLQAEASVEVGVTRGERRDGGLAVRADDRDATLVAGCRHE